MLFSILYYVILIGIYEVELFTTGNKTTIKFTSSQPSTFQTISLLPGTEDKFRICHILPNGVFYLQKELAIPLLDNLSSRLTLHIQQSGVKMKTDDMKGGAPCVVNFNLDKKWYRGKIIKFSSLSHVEVQFVDYGNEDIVAASSLYVMPEGYLTNSIQAVPAVLHSKKEQSSYSDNDLKTFQSETDNVSIYAKILSKEGDIHIVQLFFANREELSIGPRHPGFKKNYNDTNINDRDPPGFKKSYPNEFGSSSIKDRLGYIDKKSSATPPPSRDRNFGRNEEYNISKRDRDDRGFHDRPFSSGFLNDRDSNKERSDKEFDNSERRNKFGDDREERNRSSGDRREFGNRTNRGGFSGSGGNREGRNTFGSNREGSSHDIKEGKDNEGFSNRHDKNGFGSKDDDNSNFTSKGERNFGGNRDDRGNRTGFGGNRNEGNRNSYGGNREDRGGRSGFGSNREDRGGRSGYGSNWEDRGGRSGFGGNREDRGDRSGFGGKREERGSRSGFSGNREERGGFGGNREERGRRSGFNSDDRSGDRNRQYKEDRSFQPKTDISSSIEEKSSKEINNDWGDEGTENKDILGTSQWAASSSKDTFKWDTKPQSEPTDEYIIERLVINQAYEATLPYLENSMNFYCSLTSKTGYLSTVMDKLAQMAESNLLKPMSGSELTVGKPIVAVFSEDSCYYRAKVASLPNSDQSIEVHFVDYGNKEYVPIDKCTALDPELLMLPAQAIPCKLISEVENFSEIIGNYEMIKVKANNVDGDRATVDILTTDGKLIFKTKSSQIGKKYKVYFSYILSPFEFYCQKTDTKVLDDIINELANLKSVSPLPTHQIQPGQMCIANYSDDNSLYRAMIIEVIDGQSKINLQFVDFGNSEVVPASKISMVPSNLATIPFQAYKCAVLKSEQIGLIPDKQITQFNQQITTLQSATLYVKDVPNNLFLYVDILDDVGNPIPLPFTTTNESGNTFATIFTYPEGAGLKCLITHILTPNDFFCQHSTKLDQLGQLQRDIVNDIANASLHQLTRPQIGDVCIAYFAKEDAWYRAVIIRICNNKYEIMYVDYGNTDTVAPELLLNIKDEYRKYSPFAFSCSLEKHSGWESTYLKDFKEKYENQKVVVHIMRNITPHKYEVKLFDEFGIQEVILYSSPKTLPPKVEKKIVKFKEISLLLDEPIQVYISHSNSINSFFVQKIGIEDELADLMSKVSDLCNSTILSPLAEFKVGTACFAKFTDEVWYRAVINEITENNTQIKVLYVDYGNTELIANDRILSISPSLLEQPPFAIHCRLSYSYGVISNEAIDQMFSEYTECSLLLCPLLQVSNGIYDCTVSHKPEDGEIIDLGLLLNSLIEPEIAKKAIARDLDKLSQYFANSILSNSLKSLSMNSSIPTFKCPILPIDTKCNIFLSQIAQSTDAFYVQVSSGNKEQELDNLMEAISNYCLSEDNLTIPDELYYGQACLVKYSLDNCWYRAKIIDIYLYLEHVNVLYVDYGNTELVHLSSVTLIPAGLVTPPTFAYLCKFDNSYLIPDGYDITGVMSPLINSLLQIEISHVSTSDAVHYARLLTSDHQQDIGKLVSETVSPEIRQQMLKQIQIRTVNSLVKNAIDNSINRLSSEIRYKQIDIAIEQYAQKCVDIAIDLSRANLVREEEIAIDNLINNTLNDSLNALTKPKTYPVNRLPTNCIIFVTHVNSTESFYVQQMSEVVDQFQLTQNIENFCSDPNNIVPQPDLEIGMPVLSVFSDDLTWYRGLVVDKNTSEDKTYTVRFVDYGNLDTVSIDKTCYVPDNLLHKQQYSYECKFLQSYGLEQSSIINDNFLKLTNEITELLLEVVNFEDNIYEVKLFDKSKNNAEIGMILGQPRLSIPSPNDGPCEIIISQVNSVNSIYLHTPSNLSSLNQLNQTISNFCTHSTNQPIKESVTPGLIVLGYLPHKYGWYRMVISQTHNFESGEFQCYLLDYGDSCPVPLSQMRTVAPDSNFATLPPFVFHCKLPEYECILSSMPVLQELTPKAKLTAIFSAIQNDNMFVIELYNQDKRLLSHLRSLSLPFKVFTYHLPEVSSSHRVFISYITNVTDFNIQFIQSSNHLIEMMEQISIYCTTYSNLTPLLETELVVGRAVLSIFAEDQTWYRTRIDKIDDLNHITVTYIDYGNSEITDLTKIRDIPERFLYISPLSFNSHFTSEIGLVSCQEVEGKFAEYLSGTEFEMRVYAIFNNSLQVELFPVNNITQSLGETLYYIMPKELQKMSCPSETPVSLFSEPAASLQPISSGESSLNDKTFPTIGTTVKAFTSHINSIDDFYIQLSGCDDDLAKLGDQIDTTVNDSVNLNIIQDLKPSLLVLAKFSDDELYYRGIVSHVDNDNDKCTVIFTDYGNSESIDKSFIFELSQQLQQAQYFAYRCKLYADSINDHSNIAINTIFKELVTEKELEVSVTDIDESTLLVKVSIESIPLSDLITNQHSTYKEASITGAVEETIESGEESDDSSNIDDAIDTPDIPRYTEIELTDEIGKEYEVTLSHCESLDSFYYQKMSEASKLSDIMSGIVEYVGEAGDLQQPPKRLTPEMAVIAVFEEGVWYRAKVIEVMAESCTVLYIDYGNEEEVTLDKILPILDQLLHSPLAYHCELLYDTDKYTPCDDITDKLNSMENNISIKVVSVNGDKLCVELIMTEEIRSQLFQVNSI